MDSVDVSAVASMGGDKRRVNKKNRDWHKWLHLRKTAVQPPTMQSEDKHGPKKIAEEWEQSTVWPSSKKPPQEAQQRTDDSGNTLRFTCSHCRDNLEYVPKDLVRHFEEKHSGIPPVFSCHMCTYSTHEFSYLQVHLLSHKDTFSSCSVCNDNVQRTWPEFSAHLTMCHCQNGKYSCEVCHKFSTGDINVFLEHVYTHHLGQEGGNEDLSLHTKDKNKFGLKRATRNLRCQHCDYATSEKWLIAKHIKVCRAGRNGYHRKKKKKETVRSVEMKTNAPIPEIKPRLTRSAVREMCWLTQDCLSLPGREFLDKYCHLSDPQTTLEETQQFLMKSVAGETGDQKWTKALKTVFSNVPQDMNLHPKSDNGMSNSSDLAVLTVKNKITVAQNGGTYAKKLKMMTSSDKEVSPTSADDDATCVVDQNGRQSNLNDHTPAPQAETKLNNDASLPAQNEPSECTQMQENRENEVVKTDQGIEEHGQNHDEPMHEDRINSPGELKLTNESERQTPKGKVQQKNKQRRQRRKRKARARKSNKGAPAVPLKIVLKKNPVKEKQWLSQSPLSPSRDGLTDEHSRLPSPHTTLEKTVQILQSTLLMEANQKKWTKAAKTDLHNPPEAITSILPSKPGEEPIPNCAEKPHICKGIDGNAPDMLAGLLSMDQEMPDVAEKLETEVDMCSSAGRTDQSENIQVQESNIGRDCHASADEMSSAANRLAPHSSCLNSSLVSKPDITSQDEINSEDASLGLCPEQRSEVMTDGEVPANSCSDPPKLPALKAIQQEPSPASVYQWQLVPKNLERTLKLVAINPSQLVKRPSGDQPVVVLNHPDVDIPEVSRIMEVINRYRGEVQKVVLSRRTVNALSAKNGQMPSMDDLTDAQPDFIGNGRNSVQERFLLKLKLRRLSRKKYEVVDAVPPSRDIASKFRCWFCGRVFTSQETWMVHRQRHLMEWKRPNCENLNVVHTG